MDEAASVRTPKELGAFYTPTTIADMLADWVVRTGQERLLEPSVGGAALVDACIGAAVRKGGGKRCRLRFLGCDIDSGAISKLQGNARPNLELRAIDFLQLDPASTGKFTGVIANPPFTRNHAIDFARRNALRARFGIRGAAGLWVHFLLHALEFVAPGGRLAFVVPSAALFTRYGREAIERVCASFGHVEIRKFVDKPLWTNGAEERGALILCHGFGGSCEVPPAGEWLSTGDRHRMAAGSRAFAALAERAVPLGRLGRLSIGAVTGCNSIFLLTDEEREELNVPEGQLRLIVSRARQVRGLSIDETTLRSLDKHTSRTWLLFPASLDQRNTGVRRRLAQIPPKRRKETVWFGKRSPWWRVDVGAKPDAIFTYMNDLGPRLTLVEGDIWCTNTLHAIHFLGSTDPNSRMAAALSMISTFGALAAERLGRVYGGGLLKFELIDARRMPILLCDTELRGAFRRANEALIGGDVEGARLIADEAMLAPVAETDWRDYAAEMGEELQRLRHLLIG